MPSIVKGASGRLHIPSGLITSNDWCVLLWIKDPLANTYCSYFYSENTPTNYVRLDCNAGPIRARSVQQFSAIAQTVSSLQTDVWAPVIGYSDSTSGTPSIDCLSESVTASGGVGIYQTPTNPSITLMQRNDTSGVVPDGTKYGAVAVFSLAPSPSDISLLLSGEDPTEIGNLIEYWSQYEGISESSGDLISWTGVNGNVLTPSGIVTVDSADEAPVSVAGGSLTTPTDPLNLDSTSNTVTATGFTGDLTSLTDQDSGYAYTVTDQTGGTVTFDAPPLTSITEVDGAVVTPPLGSVTLVGTYTPSDPDEVATVATTIALPAGYESVTLSGSSNVEGTVGYGLNDVHSVLPVDGWVAIYPTATSTVDADGTVYFSESSVYYYMYNPTTYEMYAIQFVFTAGDSITPEQLSVLRLKLKVGITLDLHYDLKIPLRG